MLIDPVEEQDYYDPNRSFKDTKLILGNKNFRFTSNPKDRIEVKKLFKFSAGINEEKRHIRIKANFIASRQNSRAINEFETKRRR